MPKEMLLNRQPPAIPSRIGFVLLMKRLPRPNGLLYSAVLIQRCRRVGPTLLWNVGQDVREIECTDS